MSRSFYIVQAFRSGTYALPRDEQQHHQLRVVEPEHKAWKNLRFIFGVLETAGYVLEVELSAEIKGRHDILDLNLRLCLHLYMRLPELPGQVAYRLAGVGQAAGADAVHLPRREYQEGRSGALGLVDDAGEELRVVAGAVQ